MPRRKNRQSAFYKLPPLLQYQLVKFLGGQKVYVPESLVFDRERRDAMIRQMYRERGKTPVPHILKELGRLFDLKHRQVRRIAEEPGPSLTDISVAFKEWINRSTTEFTEDNVPPDSFDDWLINLVRPAWPKDAPESFEIWAERIRKIHPPDPS